MGSALSLGGTFLSLGREEEPRRVVVSVTVSILTGVRYVDIEIPEKEAKEN